MTLSYLRRRLHQWWVWWWIAVDTGGALCQTVLYPLARNQYAGRQLQLWSNLGLTFALGAYVTAVVQASWLGRGLFAVYLAAGVSILTLCITIRDVRLLRTIRARAKEM